MEKSEKIISDIIHPDFAAFKAYFDHELPSVQRFIFIGEREENHPNGKWVVTTNYKKSFRLADAILNMMARHEFFANAVLYAAQRYLRFVESQNEQA